jgi:hypothetical protein
VDHQTDLSIGESSFLAVYVVPVAGYSYVNADDSEIEATIELLDSVESDAGYDLFGAVSLHSVVADDPSQNTARTRSGNAEVGFLGLVQFNEVVPAGFEEQAASNSVGGAPIARLEMSDIPVFVFEDPESADSRYTYAWFEHGTQAFIDGADQEPLERWIDAYLQIPKLTPNETVELDALLVALERFTYANFDPAIQPEIDEALGQYPYSAHRVADTEDVIGTLLLVESSDDSPFATLIEGFGFERTVTKNVDGVTVDYWASVDDPTMAFMEWTQNNYHGGLATNAEDAAATTDFLAEFWNANR